MMPPPGLMLRCQRDLTVETQWHRGREALPEDLPGVAREHGRLGAEILHLFRGVYGETELSGGLQRWRIFFMACESCSGTRGCEWFVAHYLLRPRS